MPKLRNLFQIDGVWYCRFRVGGRLLRRSLRTKSEVEAKRRLKVESKKIKRMREVMHYADGVRRSYMEAHLVWRAEYPAQVKPSTMKRYLVSTNQLSPFFKKRHLDEINRKTIAEYVSTRKREGATNATIRRDLTALSRIMATAAARDWIEFNPVEAYDRGLIKERRPVIRPPRDEDVKRVVDKAPAMLGYLVRVLEKTGMRSEEAVSLEHDQIDLAKKVIRLYETKTSRPRVVPLDLPLTEEAGIILGSIPRHLHSRFVFWHHEDGDRYRGFSTRFAAITASVVEDAKDDGEDFRRFRAHDLRHKFAIDFLEAGGTIYELQKILGHTSIKTTEGYLQFVSQEVSERVSIAARSDAGNRT